MSDQQSGQTAVILKWKRPATSLRMRRAWYAPEGDPPATPPATPPAQPAQPAATPPPAPKPADELPDWVKDPAKAYAEIQKVREEAAQHRREKADFEKRLAAIEDEKRAAQDNKLKEQNEWKTLAEKREVELNALNNRVMRMEIASELGLTPSQAKRLQGSTEAELREDAKALLADLGLDKPKPETAPAAATPASTPEAKPDPQPAKPEPARSQRTAVAPGGQPVVETDEQRRARLYKRGALETPLFNPPKT